MTDRLTPEREAEIAKFRDQCHPVTGVLSVGRVHAALDDLLAELAAVRAERDEARARVAAVDGLSLPEKLKVDTIAPEYRNGYVHALADMREAWIAPAMEVSNPQCTAEYGAPGHTHCELPAGHEGQHASAIGNMRRATWGGGR